MSDPRKLVEELVSRASDAFLHGDPGVSISYDLALELTAALEADHAVVIVAEDFDRIVAQSGAPPNPAPAIIAAAERYKHRLTVTATVAALEAVAAAAQHLCDVAFTPAAYGARETLRIKLRELNESRRPAP